ncbi:alpha-mannosidase [soil metagenome]
MIDVHLISHTHWDREWYLTREQFRLRLVELVDRVLKMLRDDTGYAYFHLDGQTIVLEDYLELHPENADEIRGLIRDGRLLVGPWYVMPDEFLVSGESLVRNLALGHRIARAFGGSMPVGYLPDLFGHVGQMPQILRQFGLDNAILWRGFGGAQAEYWWQSPDGSRVLMMHLPGEGYCNATRIALVPDQMVARTEAVIEREALRTRYGVVLLMNGVDHIEPQATIPALVSAMQARSHQIRHSTLPAYVDAVRSGAAKDGESLEVIHGELRSGEQYAPLLPGVLSARTYLKRANAGVQTALERWAEPLATWAWLLGERYPGAALHYAWKVLLQNHPHDSICGCSIDEVHEENMSRFARAGQVAEDVIERSSSAIARRIDRAPEGHVRVVFFNTSGRAGTRVVEGSVDLPFGNAEPHRHVDPEALDAPVVFFDNNATIVSASLAGGAVVPLQVLGATEVISWVKSRYDTSWALHARRIRFAALVDLPACGYASVDLRAGIPATPTEPVVPSTGTIENDLLKVTVAHDGTAKVVDKRSGKIYERCGELLDEADVGDEYNYSPPRIDQVITSRALLDVTVETAHSGPLRNALSVRGALPVPIRATADRRAREAQIVRVPVAIEIALDAGSARAQWRVSVDNRARDHRLRLLFPSGFADVAAAVSDTAFATIARPTRRDAPATIRTEVPVTSAPMQSFVACPDAGGAAVFAPGLNEYEVLLGESARIAVTLLRCVGDLSRDDLTTRPHGHAGPGLSTPGAQCIGSYSFVLGFEPLHRTPDAVDLYASASAIAAPPRMAVADAPGQVLAARAEMLELHAMRGDVVLSALKKTEDRESVTIRVFTPAGDSVNLHCGLAGGLRDAAELNLLEEPQRPLDISSGMAAVAASAFGVRTMELVPAQAPHRRAPR